MRDGPLRQPHRTIWVEGSLVSNRRCYISVDRRDGPRQRRQLAHGVYMHRWKALGNLQAAFKALHWLAEAPIQEGLSGLDAYCRLALSHQLNQGIDGFRSVALR